MVSEVGQQSLDTLCHLCRTGVYDFDVARSFGLYNEPMVRAILMLKHEGIPPLGVWFAKRLHEIIASDRELFAADVIVPVPLHSTRRRERGYNQAELIAKPLGKLLHLSIEPRALVRKRPRPGVLRLTREQRWETVHGAFTPDRAANVDNRRVLLLDDVFTTGATLDSCSRELRRAGAARVIALTAARAAANWWGLGF
jgi:competence protein ComFC